uniref:Uncharacterized protein n=1 Tax=Ditylenchus dipsaci TaxID=166011 RepID=A0A915ETF8_9BILA
MGISHFCTFCISNPSRSSIDNDTKQADENADPEEEPYGTIPAVEPSSSATTSSSAGPSKAPAQPKGDPPSRKKKVSFSWKNRRKSSDTGPAYDYIDAEGGDPVYSKVDENLPSLRYDYPTFSSRERTRKPVVHEPFYTSASLHSQIYSGGSEDPYSSIISEGVNVRADENNSTTYDTGYARVKGDASKPTNSLRAKHNLDALYAKINRRAAATASSSSSRHLLEPCTSSAGASGIASANNIKLRSPIVAPPPHNFLPTSTVTDQPYQLEESGSGSIASGSSQNPSYRYLTVRESVDVVRERLRQRDHELTNGQRNIRGLDHFPLREHYYSTIANEYESVGDENPRSNNYGLNNGSEAGSSTYSTHNNTLIIAFLGMALIETTRASSTSPPPTSPIPNRVDQQPPPVIVRPVVLSPTVPFPRLMSASYTSQPSQQSTSSSEKTSSNPNLFATKGQGGQSKNRFSYSHDPRVLMNIPVSVRMSYLHRHLQLFQTHLQQASSKETSERQSQTQQSRIPVPLSTSNILTLRSRTPSPTVEAGTQTSRTSGLVEHQHNRGTEASKKKVPKPLPLQVGNDYVSPVDLSNNRGWPLYNSKEEGTAEKLEQ